ncbi:MAG: FAD-dependent oxidoreductase, partial [Candidatus Thiodiazotropha endolucinida]|nr:FAD-dependent oxidoreductase [Candidatus Thiodiazotropha taylori]MCW4240338.1 FAD-dependent oxidoreductase [Candidatus Thiodiazotropha taylori]
MAHIVVIGAGTGGMPCAYELRMELGREHEVTMINEREYFQFVPSNPWLAVGWRDRSHITFDIRPHLERKGINFIAQRVDKIDADANRLTLDNGDSVDFDYL